MSEQQPATEQQNVNVDPLVSIAGIAKDIHQNAIDHGWWETKREIPELLCLVHSEVSEALEAYRNRNMNNFSEELADVVIRVFDLAEGYGINIQAWIQTKHNCNKARAYRHGGKVC